MIHPSIQFPIYLLGMSPPQKKERNNLNLRYLTKKIFNTPPPQSHLHIQQYHTPRPPGALHIPNSCQMSVRRVLINRINPINEQSTKQQGGQKQEVTFTHMCT